MVTSHVTWSKCVIAVLLSYIDTIMIDYISVSDLRTVTVVQGKLSG